ncbi:hypothetical protein IKH83_02575 [Candidatus Saccharibacteria bacterium]|nr:hypothetical protein [Candidatus Saccharibacteria bacterium]
MKIRRTADVKTNPNAARSRRQAKKEIKKFLVTGKFNDDDGDTSAPTLELKELENTA